MDKPLLWSGYIYFYSNLAFINSNFQGDSAKPSDITITLIMAVKSVKKDDIHKDKGDFILGI